MVNIFKESSVVTNERRIKAYLILSVIFMIRSRQSQVKKLNTMHRQSVILHISGINENFFARVCNGRGFVINSGGGNLKT